MLLSYTQLTAIIIALGIAWAWCDLWRQYRGQYLEGEGWLYFIGNGRGPIKVGVTHNDPEERLADLQTGNPNKLRVLYATRMENLEEAEGLSHNYLGEHHVGGEWYERNAVMELMAELGYQQLRVIEGGKE
jgi:hypothetical protein